MATKRKTSTSFASNRIGIKIIKIKFKLRMVPLGSLLKFISAKHRLDR